MPSNDLSFLSGRLASPNSCWTPDEVLSPGAEAMIKGGLLRKTISPTYNDCDCGFCLAEPVWMFNGDYYYTCLKYGGGTKLSEEDLTEYRIDTASLLKAIAECFQCKGTIHTVVPDFLWNLSVGSLPVGRNRRQIYFIRHLRCYQEVELAKEKVLNCSDSALLITGDSFFHASLSDIKLRRRCFPFETIFEILEDGTLVMDKGFMDVQLQEPEEEATGKKCTPIMDRKKIYPAMEHVLETFMRRLFEELDAAEGSDDESNPHIRQCTKMMNAYSYTQYAKECRKKLGEEFDLKYNLVYTILKNGEVAQLNVLWDTCHDLKKLSAAYDCKYGGRIRNRR